ncbi:hypothetical protein ABG768_008768 [Culter alburnus]|uniref:Uncharacterized protein n=1 Tax=Culter alburnus TaxID=194366 RepID=A0AAW1ZJV7_CULAL
MAHPRHYTVRRHPGMLKVSATQDHISKPHGMHAPSLSHPHQYHNLSCPAIPSVLSIRIREPARPLRMSLNFCVIAGTQKQPSVCVSMRTRAWAQMSRSGAVSMRLL